MAGFRDKLLSAKTGGVQQPIEQESQVRFITTQDIGSANVTENENNEAIAKIVAETIRRNRSSYADDLFTPEKTQELEKSVRDILDARHSSMSTLKKSSIVRIVTNELTGAGPLEPLIKNPQVTEIMVNGPKMVYVERNGELVLTDVTFRDEAHLKALVDKWLSMVGRRYDEIDCDVDARLPQGYRIHVMGPPIALDGPHVTIRKHREKPMTAQDLISYGTVSPEIIGFMEWMVRNKRNIVVSGGTSSGKTSNLNVLSDFIEPHERVIVVEDSHELKLKSRHTLYWETRPANVEGRGRKTMQDLVKNSLRARPDRIVVGEVRGAEALDMIQAANTGHDGILTTLHANSCEDALRRIEFMVLQGGLELPAWALREYITSGIHVVIQAARIGRYSKRKIVEIAEVLGVDKDNRYRMNTLFALEERDDDAVLVPTGNRPSFYNRLDDVNRALFDRAPEVRRTV